MAKITPKSHKLKVNWTMDENHIYGITGVKNGKIVEPSIPDCDIGIVINSGFENMVYVVESGKMFVYHANGELSRGQTPSDSIKAEICEYLNSDNIQIVDPYPLNMAAMAAKELQEEEDKRIFQILSVLSKEKI